MGRRVAAWKAVFLAVSSLAAASLVAVGSSAGASTGVALLKTARVTVTSSVPGPPIYGAPEEFDPSNTTSWSGSATTSAVHVALEGGTGHNSVSVDLIAPTAAPFRVGSYFGDDVYGVRGWGRIAAGEGCSYVQFTIVDIASTATSLTRLDVRFQTVCGEDTSSNVNATTFGELQLGEPEPSATLVSSSRSPSWPDVAVGTRSAARWPIWIRNISAATVTVGALTRGGTDPAEFPLISDSCSHRTLAAHTGCSVVVGFQPAAAGARSATVTLAAGATNAIKVFTALNGTGTPGTTSLRLISQPGDPIGRGRSRTITNAQEPMYVATQMPYQFTALVPDPDGFQWIVQVGAGAYAPMTLGTHAVTDDAKGGTWGLSISGDGTSCDQITGSVTVKELSYDADHAPTDFDLIFLQKCAGYSGSLSGEIKYHAGTRPTNPPPVSYADDTFARTVSPGFGTADPVGGAWTPTGSTADLAVTPAHGTVKLGPGQSAGAYLGSGLHTSSDVRLDFSLNRIPVGGSGYSFYVIARRVSRLEQYEALVQVAPHGAVTVSLYRIDGSATPIPTYLQATVGTVAAGQSIHVRFDALGQTPTTLLLKTWLGSTEPAAWLLTGVDSSPPSAAPGAAGFTTYLAKSTSNGPITAAISRYSVTSD